MDPLISYCKHTGLINLIKPTGERCPVGVVDSNGCAHGFESVLSQTTLGTVQIHAAVTKGECNLTTKQYTEFVGGFRNMKAISQKRTICCAKRVGNGRIKLVIYSNEKRTSAPTTITNTTYINDSHIDPKYRKAFLSLLDMNQMELWNKFTYIPADLKRKALKDVKWEETDAVIPKSHNVVEVPLNGDVHYYMKRVNTLDGGFGIVITKCIGNRSVASFEFAKVSCDENGCYKYERIVGCADTITAKIMDAIMQGAQKFNLSMEEGEILFRARESANISTEYKPTKPAEQKPKHIVAAADIKMEVKPLNINKLAILI